MHYSHFNICIYYFYLLFKIIFIKHMRCGIAHSKKQIFISIMKVQIKLFKFTYFVLEVSQLFKFKLIAHAHYN